DRSQGGLGLGLALAKSLVELHGGQVGASSAGPGKGSTFTVRLPRLAEEAPFTARAAMPSIERRGGPAAPLRILLVDDNKDAVQTLQLFLQAAGHSVQAAYRGADGIEVARAFRPQVCLLDIGLPDFDGNELARRLRAMPETAGATLVALTGYGRQQDRDAASDAGFDHYLVKPVNTVQLTHMLGTVGAAQS
ncbi:MAG: ATP-binding response regulator, partial [Ramlibacter sp.]